MLGVFARRRRPPSQPVVRAGVMSDSEVFFIWLPRLPGRRVCVCVLSGAVLYAEIGSALYCGIGAGQHNYRARLPKDHAKIWRMPDLCVEKLSRVNVYNHHRMS